MMRDVCAAQRGSADPHQAHAADLMCRLHRATTCSPTARGPQLAWHALLVSSHDDVKYHTRMAQWSLSLGVEMALRDGLRPQLFFGQLNAMTAWWESHVALADIVGEGDPFHLHMDLVAAHLDARVIQATSVRI